ncbi:MAG TPA: RIP metalloprotease RseP [Bryobacteraceae bacterium]|nr:RIP metalloprotease RseP [Bryobacteraceae bacterium]
MLVFENILWLLVLIGVMIMIHELGHFWAARFFDVKVEAFSFGFGPRLFGFRRGETDYRFSLVLFGGYVKMAGEQVTDENIDDPRSFLAKPRWQRLIIAFAGPFMNVVLAIGLLTGLYMVKYQRVSDADMQAVIGHVMPDSPAAKAGVQDGDRIVRLDGKANPTWEDVALKEVASAYRPMYLTIERKGKYLDLTVTPTLSDRTGVGFAGWDERGQVQLGDIEPGMPAEKAGLKKGDLILAANGESIHSQIKFHEVIRNSNGKPVQIEFERNGQKHEVAVQPEMSKIDGPERWMIGVVPEQKLDLITTRLSLPDAFRESMRQNGKGAMLIGEFLKGVVERRMSAKTITGPIGIAQLSGEAAREGPSAFIILMSVVSLNLAIFNLLPIPILDGGVILMLLVEMTMQRDLSLNVKEAVFKVGFVFIMMLVAFVIYNDISKIFPAG